MVDTALHIELYKKYRPTKWAGLIGQEKVAKSLQAAVVADKIPTAYLMSGPRGCGKTSAAFLLAKAVNCEQPVQGNPCNVCQICVSIDNNSQPGVTYISAAQKSGVDDIRELVQQARLQMPIKKQVFIIDEIHNLKQGKGFEALLIPLEEKTMPALFIFCTTEIEKVPQTILSRVQQRRFTLVGAEQMLSYIQKIGAREKLNLTEEDYESAVREGRGSVRDTLTSLETIVTLGAGQPSFGGQLLEAIAGKSMGKVYQVLAEANQESVDFRALSEQLFEDLRDLLLLAAQVDRRLVGAVPVADVEGFLAKVGGHRGLFALLNEVGEAITHMANGMDSRIMLEVALMKALLQVKRVLKTASEA